MTGLLERHPSHFVYQLKKGDHSNLLHLVIPAMENESFDLDLWEFVNNRPILERSRRVQLFNSPPTDLKS